MEAVNLNAFININSLLLIAFGLWLYWLWQRRHLYRFALNFPGKWGAPLMGEFYQITKMNHLIPFFNEQFKKFNTACIWLGLYPIIMTQEPEFIDKVLSSPDLLNKAKTFYASANKFFEGGIIASPADKWLHNRKLINPCFNHKVLLSLFPLFNKAKRLTFLKFDVLVNKEEQKLLDILRQISMVISIETTLGNVLSEDDASYEDLPKKLKYLLKCAMVETFLSTFNLGFLVSLNYRFWKIKQYMRNYAIQTIEKKYNSKQQKIQNNQTKDDKISSNVKHPYDFDVSIKKAHKIFIDQAIQLYETGQFTWHDMQSESNTIVTAATETSANSTFAALVMLAMHPDVQEKLYEELISVFPDKDFEMEYSHIQQLPYLDMVINEVLRLNPAVPVIGRQVMKDTQLTKGILLPKGLQIIISIFHLHRRTDVWGPNAEQFNPDNFLAENLKGKHSHAYMPFSKGNRNCVGWRYAIFSMKVMIAGFIRNYRFTTTFKYENLRYVSEFALFYIEEPGIEIQRR